MTNSKDHNSNQGRRTISDVLAPVIEHLELEADTLVTLEDLIALRPDVPESTIRGMASELVQRGWLRPLKAKGAYEFIPGAAAGPYPSGDPWLELRAALKLSPGMKAHVGLASAAWILGYRERSPGRQVVFATRDPKPPPSLSQTYDLVKTARNRMFGSNDIRGVPVASIERIYLEAAWRTDKLDVRTDVRWISRLISNADPQVVVEYLELLSIKSVWARAGYLAEIIGNPETAEQIRVRSPISGGPYYFGNTKRTDYFVVKWNLYDNMGLWRMREEISGDDK